MDSQKKPKILLIGDSIRIAYAPFVRKNLENEAEILEIPTNGEHSRKVKKNLKTWLKKAGAPDISIIHFNCGVHDAKQHYKKTQNYVPLSEYEKNLKKIVEILKKYTTAKLIWATTTPVIYERHSRQKPEYPIGQNLRDYISTAVRIMNTEGIEINDLYNIIIHNSVEECLSEDGIHMADKGNKILVQTVTEKLRNHLNN